MEVSKEEDMVSTFKKYCRLMGEMENIQVSKGNGCSRVKLEGKNGVNMKLEQHSLEKGPKRNLTEEMWERPP